MRPDVPSPGTFDQGSDLVRPWTVTARNLPEHARNAIHTDAGARAAGFPRALVAGVTTYAYLTRPLVEAWGRAWLTAGSGEVRFRRPVFDGDSLTCVPVVEEGTLRIEARTTEPEQPRAVLVVRPGGASPSALRPGEQLAPLTVDLVGEWGADYGLRAGEDCPLYTADALVHPAVWPALANQVVHTQVARGAWIHTRSLVRHHAAVPAGATAVVRSCVVQRFSGHGERAVLDVQVEVAGGVAVSIEHEAIVALP